MNIEFFMWILIVLMIQGSCFLFVYFKLYKKYRMALLRDEENKLYCRRIINIINFRQSEYYSKTLLEKIANKPVVLYGFNYACKDIVEALRGQISIDFIVENNEENIPDSKKYRGIQVVTENNLPELKDYIFIVCIINNKFTIIADQIRRKFYGNDIICLPHLLKNKGF